MGDYELLIIEKVKAEIENNLAKIFHD